MTKLWLKDSDYEFDEYNVSESKENTDMLLRLGFHVTPVTVIGETMIAGFSPNKFEKALS